MYNDFVIVGPASDPAGVATKKDLQGALETMAAAQTPFLSRGDDSGTHLKELSLWRNAKLAPEGTWYRETGSGMGSTLRIAIEMNGYTLTDRATWLSYGRKMDHRILFEGDPALFNQYGIIAVNPTRYPHVREADASAFLDWMLGERGQSLIASYKLGDQQLFFPNAED
jgi:tungstate transport system substrate-binding protein